MNRILSLFSLSLLCAMSATNLNAEQAHQYYEIRSYTLGDKSDVEAVDQYLRDALLPALERQGIGPVGVFTNSPADETGRPCVIAVIPYESADAMTQVKAKIESDKQYQSASNDFHSRNNKQAAYGRIESELLISMDCMRQLNVPEGSLENSKRVYELRVYESANQRLGNLKVDMFNNGEVPIFLDCGIQPIFIGQAVVGPYTPNLTYLTMYPNETARQEAWVAFRKHPDWQVLKAVEKYKGTVSKIHKFVLEPKSYSQM